MSTTPYIPNFSSSGLGYSPSYQAPITSLTPIILTPLELVSGDSFFRDTVLVSPCGTWAQQVFLTVVQDLGTTYPSATGTISVDSSFTSIIPPILTITPPTPLENEDPFVDYSISQHQYELASSLDGLSWNTFLIAPTPVTGTLRSTVVVPQSSRYIRAVFSSGASEFICGEKAIDLTLSVKDFSWYPFGNTFTPTGTVVVPPPSSTGTVVIPILPVYNSNCLPGVLEQSPSFLPGLFVNDANLPLVGFSSTLREQWPDWFDTSYCGLLHRVSRVFGQSLDQFSIVKDFRLHSSDTTINSYSTQVEYVVDIPIELYYKEFTLSYNSEVLPLVNKESYYSSLGPCYTIIDKSLFIRNAHRQLQSLSVTGTTVTFNNTNTDHKVYYTQDYYKYLQPYRWNDTENLTAFLPSGNYSISFVTDRETLSIDVQLNYNGKLFNVIANPVKEKSFIDYSLQKFGLKYNNYPTEKEKLLALQVRNQLITTSSRKKQLYSIGYDLDTVNSFNWGSGPFTSTGTVILSKELESEYKTEFIENNTLSTKEASYVRVQGRVGQSYLSLTNTLNGVLPINAGVTGYIAEYIIPKYNILGNTYTRNSFPVDNPYITIVTGFIITTVGEISYSRLFNTTGGPSNLFLDISRSLSKLSTVNYNTSKWSGFNLDKSLVLVTDNLTFYNYSRMED